MKSQIVPIATSYDYKGHQITALESEKYVSLESVSDCWRIYDCNRGMHIGLTYTFDKTIDKRTTLRESVVKKLTLEEIEVLGISI